MTMNAPLSTQLFFSGYDRADRCDHGARMRDAATLATLLAVLGRQQGAMNVAEVGCGAGARCRRWARRGHQLYGVDINVARIGRARKRARESELEIVFDIACASALPWPDRSMDVVLATGLLMRLTNWRACLAELVRVARPGGLLYVSAGKRRSLPRRGGSQVATEALRGALAELGVATVATPSGGVLAIKAGSIDCCQDRSGNCVWRARTG